MKKEFTTVGDGEGEGDGGVLPDVIVEEILSRLHSKTLIKLRIVCKRWKSLISTSCFKRLHHGKSLESPKLLLLSHSTSHGSVLITTMSLTGDVLDRWDLSPTSHKFSDMLPSQGGLVCLITESRRFVVCNPSVRKIFSLPRQKCSERVGAYGFCYLPSRNQYVVISGGEKWQMITFSDISNFEDLHTYCWKPIKDNAPGKVMNVPGGVLANGVLYWMGLTHSFSQCILCFDLYKEKFATVALRDELQRIFSWSLHDLKGDLHLMTLGDLTFGTLWKLDVTNQTWMKHYTIYMPSSNLKPLMVCEDGELMFHDGKYLELFGLQHGVFRIRREGNIRISKFKDMWKVIKLHTDALFLS